MNYLFSIYLVQGDRLPCLLRRIRVGFSYYDPNSISERSPNNSPLGSYFLEGLSRPGLVNVSADTVTKTCLARGFHDQDDDGRERDVIRLKYGGLLLMRFIGETYRDSRRYCNASDLYVRCYRIPLGEHMGANNPILTYNVWRQCSQITNTRC